MTFTTDPDLKVGAIAAALTEVFGSLTGWTCLAYCLMTTHYHFVLRVDDGELSAGMERLNGNYAVTVSTIALGPTPA